MHREMGQPSLVESLLPEKLGQNQRLDRIHQAVDWDRLRNLAAQVYGAPEGRPSYPPLLMVKVLLLEQWYNLSDPQMEETLGDRISFRRFVGLGLQENAPDHSTISRFRTALAAGGLDEKLFQELGLQLEQRGLVLKAGTLMDATVVDAQVRRPPTSAGRGGQKPRRPRCGLDVYQSRGALALRLQGACRGGCGIGDRAHGGVDPGQGLRKHDGRCAGERGRGGGLRRSGVRVPGTTPVAAVPGHQGPDHASFSQTPAGVAWLAATAQ